MKQHKKLHIIVAEDNLFYQQLIAKQLEPISAAIHFFTNGEDCVDKMEIYRPDLIVLDNNLGGAMSGLDTLKIIRLKNQEIPVILFSTDQALDSAENLSLYGFFVYVEKNNSGFKSLKNRIMESKVYAQSPNL